MEYVIEAHDTDDMRSWLATVKYCMRSVQQPSSDSADTRLLYFFSVYCKKCVMC